MALQDVILSRIDEILSTAVSDRAALSLLREAAQGYSAVRCDAEDMQDEEPFRAYPRCDLFLLDARDHCFRITQDIADATGFVVAPKRNPSGESE